MLPPERMSPQQRGPLAGEMLTQASLPCKYNFIHKANRVGCPIPVRLRPMTDSVTTSGLTRVNLAADVIGDHA